MILLADIGIIGLNVIWYVYTASRHQHLFFDVKTNAWDFSCTQDPLEAITIDRYFFKNGMFITSKKKKSWSSINISWKQMTPPLKPQTHTIAGNFNSDLQCTLLLWHYVVRPRLFFFKRQTYNIEGKFKWPNRINP